MLEKISCPLCGSTCHVEPIDMANKIGKTIGNGVGATFGILGTLPGCVRLLPPVSPLGEEIGSLLDGSLLSEIVGDGLRPLLPKLYKCRRCQIRFNK